MALVEKRLKSGKVVYWACLSAKPKPIWIKAGFVKGEAVRLEREWTRQLKDGTLDGKARLGAKPKVRAFLAKWLSDRQNRTAEKDRDRCRLYVEDQEWFLDLRVEEVRPMHLMQLITTIRAKHRIADKTIAHVTGLLHTMFRDAIIAEHAYVQPVVLPKNTLKTARKKDPEVYQPGQAIALMRNDRVRPEVRMLWGLLFYTGMRKGEAVGRRWDDCREGLGLKMLRVQDQYDGQPLKTDLPRAVPIHPELERMLNDWVTWGWEAVMGRKPQPGDFIIPNPRTGRCLSDHAAYELLHRSAAAVKVPWRGVHGTRHTFLTMARRSGCQKADYEKITHNAKGDIVDGYTRGAWEPLCAVVRAINFDENQDLGLVEGIGGKAAFLSDSRAPRFPAPSLPSPGIVGLRSPSAPPQERRQNEGLNRPRQKPVKNSRKRRETEVSLQVWALAHTVGALPKLSLPLDHSWVARAEAAIARLEAA